MPIPGPQDTVRFETRAYEDCAAEVVDFRNAQRETQRDKRYFDWRYAGKPTAGKAYVTFGRDSSGRAIAAAAAIPHDFHVVDRQATVAIIGDIAVLAQFRGRGVARGLLAELRRAAFERQLIGCFVLPNTDVTGSLLKAGWHQVSAIARYVRPLSVKRQARSRFGVPGALLGSVVDVFLRAGAARSGARHGFSFSRPAAVGAEYDQLWARLPKATRILAVRNRAYLQWRFIDKPGAEYQILEVRRRGELAGYVIYSPGAAVTQIEDFAVIDAAASAALGRELVSVVRGDRGADSIQARFVADTSMHVPWRSPGFVRRADAQLVLWAGAPGAPAPPPSAGWFATPGDKDV